MPNSLPNVALLWTIVLAFAGYLVTFWSNRVMARRADRLRLVNQRLNEFYGPLYVATVTGNIAYKALLAKQGKTHCHPIRDEDLAEWRRKSCTPIFSKAPTSVMPATASMIGASRGSLKKCATGHAAAAAMAAIRPQRTAIIVKAVS